MTLTADQRKALAETFQPLFPKHKIYVYDTPTGISVETPQQTIVQLVKHPKTFEILQLIGSMLTDDSPVRNQGAPNVAARHVVAIALKVKGDLELLRELNEKLLEYAMAGVALTQPKEQP